MTLVFREAHFNHANHGNREAAVQAMRYSGTDGKPGGHPCRVERRSHEVPSSVLWALALSLAVDSWLS